MKAINHRNDILALMLVAISVLTGSRAGVGEPIPVPNFEVSFPFQGI